MLLSFSLKDVWDESEMGDEATLPGREDVGSCGLDLVGETDGDDWGANLLGWDGGGAV